MKDGKYTLEDFDIVENTSEIFYEGSEWDSNNFGKFKIKGKFENGKYRLRGGLNVKIFRRR